MTILGVIGPWQIIMILIVIVGIVGAAGVLIAATTKSKGPKWCNLCNRNVVPKKKFNWLVFIFLCGVFYLPYFLIKKEQCPICEGESFSPARADEMGE